MANCIFCFALSEELQYTVVVRYFLFHDVFTFACTQLRQCVPESAYTGSPETIGRGGDGVLETHPLRIVSCVKPRYNRRTPAQRALPTCPSAEVLQGWYPNAEHWRGAHCHPKPNLTSSVLLACNLATPLMSSYVLTAHCTRVEPYTSA